MPLSRRTHLKALGSAASLATPAILRGRGAEAQDKPKEIRVRSWGGIWEESLRQGVADAFSEATAIPVAIDNTDDNQMVSAILDAARHDAPPPIHVDWNTTINATRLRSRYATEDLSELDGISELLRVARPFEFDDWPFVNVYSYVMGLAYRSDAFPGGPPISWQVMADPKFKDRVGLYTDGGGFFSASQVAGGGSMMDIPDDMSACWSFMEKVAANEPKLGLDPDIVAWLVDGSIDIACTITANAHAANEQGASVSVTVPLESADLATDAMAIPIGLEDHDRYWAKRFVETAISARAQQAWCGVLGLPPVYPSLAVPPGRENDPTYPQTQEQFDRLLYLPPSVVATHFEEWQTIYESIFGG